MSVSDGSNGRDKSGRFTKGNRLGRGNPHLRAISQFRRAVVTACTPEDVEVVVRKLVEKAREGNLAAARELLDRIIGKPKPADEVAASLRMPALTDVASTVEASAVVLSAMAEGKVSAESAAKMASVIEIARRTLETHELERRLEALEDREAEEE